MDTPVKLSHTSALILQTISQGYCYGFDIMDVTGLPSGTVYPALRRLERERLIRPSGKAKPWPRSARRGSIIVSLVWAVGSWSALSNGTRFLERLAPETKTGGR